MAIKCCKDCDDRSVGCHSTCARYIEEKEIHQKKKAEIDKNNRVNDEYIQYAINSSKNMKRRKRYR